MLKRIIRMTVALTAVALLMSMTACGSSSPSAVTLSDEDLVALMKQVAESDVADSYGDYLRDEAFADAEVFGIDKDGELYSAYAYLFEGEYVVLKDKAYMMSGSSGEVIIRYKYGDKGITLSEVVWSADGGEHYKWLKKNFPAKYLKKARSYEAHDADGRNILGLKLDETAGKALGVPVETDNLLEIDTEKGTYRIIRTIDGEDGRFDTEIIETGKIGDL